MEKKRSVGVTIFAILYLLFGIPFLLIILTLLISFFRMFLPNQPPNPAGSPGSIFPLVLINVVFPVVPLCLAILISGGLFKLSNEIRLQLLICNKIALLLLLIGVIYTLMLPISNNYKILVIVILLVLLGFMFASIYFFTRPKVEEQFK